MKTLMVLGGESLGRHSASLHLPHSLSLSEPGHAATRGDGSEACPQAHCVRRFGESVWCRKDGVFSVNCLPAPLWLEFI